MYEILRLVHLSGFCITLLSFGNIFDHPGLLWYPMTLSKANNSCCEPYGDTTDFAGSDLSEVKHGKI